MKRYKVFLMLMSMLMLLIFPVLGMADQVGLTSDKTSGDPTSPKHKHKKVTVPQATTVSAEAQEYFKKWNKTMTNNKSITAVPAGAHNDDFGSGAVGALTNVIVERAEQTMLVDFIKNFKNVLSDPILTLNVSGTDETLGFSDLLPKTTTMLQVCIQPGESVALGSLLSSAFNSDIKNIPITLTGYLEKCAVAVPNFKTIQPQLDSDFTEMSGAVSQIMNNNPKNVSSYYSTILSDSLDVLKNIGSQDKTVGEIYKYGSFMVEVVSSQTPNDLQSAIDSAVLPAGGYEEKKTHFLFINSYFGGNVGWERLDATQSNKNIFSANGFGGMFVPVGLEWAPFHQSFRLFASFLDLGALASFRLQDSTSNVTVGVQQVISPGIFAVSDLGFMDGFSIGTGFQVDPQLRSVSVNGNILSSNAVRYEFFLAMDLPLLTLN